MLKVWLETDDVLFTSLKQENLKEALNVYKLTMLRNHSFFEQHCLLENVLQEMLEGVSLVAVHKETNAIIGLAINTLLSLDQWDTRFPNDIGVTGTFSSSEFRKINCTLHISNLVVLKEFRGKGVGSLLCRCSIQLAKTLKSSEITVEPLSCDIKHSFSKPKAISAEFVTKESLKIATKFNFTTIQHYVNNATISYLLI